MTAPIPTGPTASFPAVKSNVATGNFTFGEGQAIVTFQPVSLNDPGVATLYDSAGNVILTMDAEGYSPVVVPVGGQTYYFSATKGANILAMTQPTIWR
jgi:hypothetical protein